MCKVQLYGGPADGTVIDAESTQAENHVLQWAHTTAGPPPGEAPAPDPSLAGRVEFVQYKWDGSYTREGAMRFVLVLSSN
jgi:hypothetical protein